MAIAKKHLGNKHEYYNVFKKHLKKYEKEQMKEVFANVDEIHATKKYSENAVPIPSCYGEINKIIPTICDKCSFKSSCKQTVTLLENAEKLNKE